MNSLKALAAAALVVAAPAVANAKQFAPRTPESIACSQQADAKNLHGKPRVAFRKDCLKAAHKATPAAATATTGQNVAPKTTETTPPKKTKKASAAKTPAPKATAQ